MMAWLELQGGLEPCIITGLSMTIPFRPIARFLTRLKNKKPDIDLTGLHAANAIKQAGDGGQGVLLTVNHFSAPDLRSWWPPILISASFPNEIHWVVASEWTDSGWRTSLTRWLFPLGARLFGFTAMPAMPPNPADVERRARAVRQVLNYARHGSHPVVGLAPEGRDFPGGVLGTLPEGAGRFIHHLSRYCQLILPIGVWVEADMIHLTYGTPYRLVLPEGLPSSQRDQLAGEIIMKHIAILLPESLRGIYERGS